MSRRTIGGVGGYYENLLIPRALFHRGPEANRSGLPAQNFDAGTVHASGY
jgi:hypothetical protein